jgi:hypothetical protein
MVEEGWITKERNAELYHMLMEKHVDGIYAKRPNPISDLLKSGESRFTELSILDQLYLFRQLLLISGSVNTGADLKLIGGSSKSGVSLISKKISGCEEVLLISVCSISDKLSASA